MEEEEEEEEEEAEATVAAVVEYGGGSGFMSTSSGLGIFGKYASSLWCNDVFNGTIGIDDDDDDDDDELLATELEEVEGVVEEDEEEEEVETLCATSDVEIFDAFNASMYFKPCVSKGVV